MLIINDALLKTYRGRNRCEGCGASMETAAHHTFVKRGLGGGTRLDCSLQLARVGWWCCHNRAEHNTAFNDHLKDIVAAREGTTVGAIEDALRWILMSPKDASPEWLLEAAQGLPEEPRRLAKAALTEAGKLGATT